MDKNEVSDHQIYCIRSEPSSRSRPTSSRSRSKRSRSRSPSSRSHSPHTDRSIGNRNRRWLKELGTNLKPHERLHVIEQNISKWEDLLRRDIDNTSRSFSSASGDENPHHDISFLTYAMKVLDYLEKKSADLTSSKFTMSDCEWDLYDSKYHHVDNS